jgi:hypothetical protein
MEKVKGMRDEDTKRSYFFTTLEAGGFYLTSLFAGSSTGICCLDLAVIATLRFCKKILLFLTNTEISGLFRLLIYEQVMIHKFPYNF